MEGTREKNEALKSWQEHCQHVARVTSQGRTSAETALDKSARVKRLLRDYDAFCEWYFPHYLEKRDPVTGSVSGMVHNAPFHSAAARKVKSCRDLKAVFMWPRGHAKSTHFDIFIPLWLMMQEPREVRFMVVVGKSSDSAIRLLGDIQTELEYNRRIVEDFGVQVSCGDWQEGEFTTKGGVHFMAVGRGQSPRGLRDRESRPDYIVIDDLDDDELCRSERRVREMTEWVKGALFGALDVGRGRFIMVGNLISRTSVLQNLSETEGVYLSKVYALDKYGEPTWKEKWTREEAESYRSFVGYKTWEKEMQHHPVTEGSIFKSEWIRWKRLPKLSMYDDLVCYTDPSLKAKTSNDYKACRLWGRLGKEYHLVDCFVRQGTVGMMVSWLYDLYERTRDVCSIRFYMEANFWQDTILDEFEREGEARGYQLPLMPDKRKKPEKLARIEAVSPLWERGYVWYNSALQGTSDMEAGIAQTLGLERGSTIHDDAPDADEGALWLMMRKSRVVDPGVVKLLPRGRGGGW